MKTRQEERRKKEEATFLKDGLAEKEERRLHDWGVEQEEESSGETVGVRQECGWSDITSPPPHTYTHQLGQSCLVAGG